jgi:CrcB protein
VRQVTEKTQAVRDARGLADGTDRTAQTTSGIRDRRRFAAQRLVLLVVSLAGALGALARYGFSRLLPSPPGRFPWGTFWVNISGSFALGLVLVLLTERFPRARVARPLLATGFLGAYTTYSTYMVDADLLLRNHDLATAALYALGSLLAGGGAALAGMWLGRLLAALDRHLDEQLEP